MFPTRLHKSSLFVHYTRALFELFLREPSACLFLVHTFDFLEILVIKHPWDEIMQEFLILNVEAKV